MCDTSFLFGYIIPLEEHYEKGKVIPNCFNRRFHLYTFWQPRFTCFNIPKTKKTSGDVKIGGTLAFLLAYPKCYAAIPRI